MKLLLDTHVLLWALLEPAKLSPSLRDLLEDSRHELWVSAASAWEIATKWRIGRLDHAEAVVKNYRQAINGLGAKDLPISAEVARQAGLFVVDHRDPFDRLLAAQAMAENLILASNDGAFDQFEGLKRLS